MIVSMQQYIEIIKHHEQWRLSTNERNKFWKELTDELAKK